MVQYPTAPGQYIPLVPQRKNVQLAVIHVYHAVIVRLESVVTLQQTLSGLLLTNARKMSQPNIVAKGESRKADAETMFIKDTRIDIALVPALPAMDLFNMTPGRYIKPAQKNRYA